ncbi:MAG: DUF4386 family protein [Anaerolineales bacterium]|nr:MAG: DUF4386 family protein [Anaerolineales bacterium]
MQRHQIKLQQIGGTAALINVAVTTVTLIVALGFIGAAALADPNKLMELAVRNPIPLIVQDALKVVSAGIAVVLILVFHSRLQNDFPRLIQTASCFGFLSVICLLINAGLSLALVTQAVNVPQEQTGLNSLPSMLLDRRGTADLAVQGSLNGLINLLGMAVILVNGLWYLLISWASLKTNRLPRWINYLGLAMGGLSLLPPLGIFVLVLGIPWSFGLGRALLNKEMA